MECLIMEREQLGWKIPPAVKKEFMEHCDKTGAKYQDALAAAMVIWQFLPPSIQRAAQLEAFGEPTLDRKAWLAFSRGLEDAILGRAYNPDRKKG